MEFNSFSEDSSEQSDHETTLSDLLNKTKTQPTKFFNELNRHQKLLSRKKMSRQDLEKKSSSNIKKKKGIPTFREMLIDSNLGISNKHVSVIPIKKDQESPGKRKVRFDSPNKPEQKRKQRKVSIQTNAPFNFYDTIKQMAFALTGLKNMPSISNEANQNMKSDSTLFTGYTEKEFQDGTKFKGICENGVIIEGQLHFLNDFIYEGELFLDKFHGKGKLTLPKGQVIEADWVEGQIVGKVTMKYPMGQIYYGDIKEFKRHGRGYLFFNDGSKYEGDFNDGQLTGYGVHTTINKEKTEGYWFYGDFLGMNEQVFENVMENTAAHENKKSQKLHKNIKYSKGRNSRNSQNLFAELLLNLDKTSLTSGNSSIE